jgi:hypothetical protein
MKWRWLGVVLGVAAVLLVGAGVVFYQVLQDYQAQLANAQSPEDTVLVLHASRTIPAGQVITEADLFMVEMSPDLVPDQAFRAPEAVVGRVAKSQLFSNEMIRVERVGPAMGPGVQRAPKVDAPDRVEPGDSFEIAVQLTATVEQVGSIDIVKGAGDKPGMLALDLPTDQSEWKLDVVVSALDLVLEQGVLAIDLPASGDSTTAIFRATAVDTGEPHIVPVTVSFVYEGSLLARVVRPVRVGDAPAVETPAPPVSLEVATAAPDLTIQVLHPDPEAPERTIVTVFGPRLATATTVLIEDRDALAAYPLGLSRLSRGKPLVSAASAGRAKAEVGGVGVELWDKRVPAVVRSAFWTLRDELGTNFRTIQVLTDDPVFPWELARPGRDDERLDPLGLDFAIARWHIHRQDRVRLRPPPRVELHDTMVVAPAYEGSQALPSVARELEVLGGMPGYRSVTPTLDGIVSALARRPQGILHYAGHGSVLEAHSAGSFVDGWAPALLEGGAPGYVGGLWALDDRAAADFASVFYETLDASLDRYGEASVAEVLRTTRQRYHRNGEATFLAYVLYGHPELKVVRAQ